MLDPRWRKVLRDLWGNKARTLLVVLSIAVGVFAVGVIAGTQALLQREMNSSWLAVDPASATHYTEPFDQEMIWSIDNMPEVSAVDAKRTFTVRFKKGTAAEHRNAEKSEQVAWRQLELSVYPDYEDIRVFKLRPEAGAWPPPEHELLIERGSLDWMGVTIGDTVLIETPGGRLREMRIAGRVHDVNYQDASWTGTAYGYISPHTSPWLGVDESFDELNFIASGDPYDGEHIEAVAGEIGNRLEKSGRTVYFTWIFKPGKHPADEDLSPILLILGVLGFMSLFLSGFLVVNTLQALLAQQVRQIGIMRSVGGTSSQIVGIYYAMIVIFALLALTLAIPLGAIGAQAFTRYMAALVNFDLASESIPAQVLALEIAIGLVVPLLAGIYPILSAMRVSAREAMSDYGLSNGHFGQSLLDRFLEKVRGISRPLLLSLRNTFRRKGRLLLTLITLTLAGAIFIAVFSVNASLTQTLQDSFDYVSYDALIIFRRNYRIDQIEDEALRVPGVTAAESWRFNTARRLRDDDSESESIFLRATPADSDLVNPDLVAGRWLLPEDENAVVINTMILGDEPDLAVGKEIVLKVEGKETSWRIVGLIKGTPPAPLAYVNLPYFSNVVGGVGRAGVVFVETTQHDAGFQNEVAESLEQHYERAGLNVSSALTSQTEIQQIQSQFDVLVMFLLFMAILLAVVGGIGLMGTMSLNVLERTREIGVMRAIGASDLAVFQIVIVEGILIGILSWLAGVTLALPLSRLMSNAVGVSIFEIPLSYIFDLNGVWLWLAISIVLATVASLLPARNATRVTVREVLAYE